MASASDSNLSTEAKPHESPPEQYFEFPRTEMLAFLPEKATRFLEIGCGAGSFGLMVKEHYQCEYWGVELDPGAAKVAEGRLDKVFEGTAEGRLPEMPEGYFDCVVYNDVLEHLVDPYAVLRMTARKLAPGGVVTSSIPNIRHFETLWNIVFKKQFKYEDAGVMDRTHLRWFTESTIRDFYEDQDFIIEKMEGINRSSSKFERLCNALTLGWLSDTLYLQFATRARPKQYVSDKT